MTAFDDALDDLRALVPQVVAVVTRRCGDFDVAEDAVQDALVEAVRTWPSRDVPDHPRGWLVATAMHRLVDARRREAARTARERADHAADPGGVAYPADDSLQVLLLCCHPKLTRTSAVALTLRAVGGLSTKEIASAYLVPERTMAQRISRAKATIRGEPLTLPAAGAETAERLVPVLKVLYLLFNEGYVASSGDQLQRVDLCAEAIRLARLAHAALPHQAELSGLLALLLLLDARRPARIDAHGAAVPLADQDRRLWDHDQIAEATALLDHTIGTGPGGPYQLQAAIASVHNHAATAEDTDWLHIAALYGLLEQVTRSPVVTLNRAVAVAYAEGPGAAERLVDTVADELADHPRLPAVRALLLELAGDLDGAAEAYARAADRAGTLPERRHLTAKAAALRDATGASPQR